MVLSEKALKNVEMVRTHARVENLHDIDATMKTLEDNCFRDEVAGKRYEGAKAVGDRYQELWKSFPDFTVTPVNLIGSEDHVVMQADYTGTHLGTYFGVQGTGKKFKVRIAVVFPFDENGIQGETIYMDLASQMRQLGLSK
jgi:steroid delta-isomerase-like uncharacterized protein